MSDLSLTATVGTFPSGAIYNTQTFANAFAARLILSIPSDSVIFGQLGGTEPTSALAGNGATPGIWFPTAYPYVWDTDAAKYLPTDPICGQVVDTTLYTTTIACGASSANTTLTTPDKSGTFALTDDLGTIIGTQTPTGTNITVDWTLKKTAYVVLSGNTTLVQSGALDGQELSIFLENNATSYTVTWTGITWPGGSAPTMTTASAGTRKVDHVKLRKVGDTIFGYVYNNGTYSGAEAAYSITTGTDSTPPTVLTRQGYSTQIYITFSELIQGGNLGSTGWTIKKNSTTQTISSVSASGDMVTIALASAFSKTSSITVQYSGSTVKDLSGNLAAAFGPSVVTVLRVPVDNGQ